ncbi:MAG: rhodanese [Gammaproteobacteria bacterium HGW-Gammaproteobacteria-11]|nr:MAG: rhodanese [Gammaproteobacteria bacterium HGW-Gammaproteobacteria-11]
MPTAANSPSKPTTPVDLNTALAAAPATLLDNARQRTIGDGYAGSLYPTEAWALVQNGEAVLIDVRTIEELKFVGRVPDSLHIAWQTGPAMIKNPRFLRELENKAGKDKVLLLLCRSGKRSAEAAKAATAAGFSHVFNILEGFEGELDPQQQRGALGGWRQHDLPWIQD